MENDQASVLRTRAAALRLLALRIIVSPAHLLAARADESTWVGPTPTRCLDELNRLRSDLTRASDELLAKARRFEAQAALLDSTGGGPGLTVR